jgi:hypothetical protein
MASSMIHLAVAKQLSKELHRNSLEYYLGSIAPDLGKIAEGTKRRSHFQDENTDYPNVDRFLIKYKEYLDNDFVMGYYVHLLTDYFWFKYFITELLDESQSIITKMDGTKVNLNGDMLKLYIYSDYTTLNENLIHRYSLDTEMFYRELPSIRTIITEIPNNQLFKLIEQTRHIIEQVKKNKEFVFNMRNIEQFIETSSRLILAEIKKLEPISQ